MNSSVSLSVMFALGLRRLLCIRSAQERSAICYIRQCYDDKNRRRDDDDDGRDLVNCPTRQSLLLFVGSLH